MAAQAADASLATEIEFEMSPQGVMGAQRKHLPFPHLQPQRDQFSCFPAPSSHQACAGPALGLLTTLCITHARQVTVERVTFATQAWPSHAAPGFSLEIGFISV